MHFEINPTQFRVRGRWPKWGWGQRPRWGWRREWDWRRWGREYEWGCTKILTQLINLQWINNSSGKNKSQKNPGISSYENTSTHVIQGHVNNIYLFEMTSVFDLFVFRNFAFLGFRLFRFWLSRFSFFIFSSLEIFLSHDFAFFEI